MSGTDESRRRLKELDAQLVHTLGRHGVDAVIDVGANIGQYAQRLRAAGWAGPILSIEPIPEVHAVLKSRACRRSGTGRWRRRSQPARQTGEIVLEVSAESDMSSTLPQSAAAARHLADLGGAAPGRRCRSVGSTSRACWRDPTVAAAVRQDRRPGCRAGGARRPGRHLGARARVCSWSWRCCRSTRASGPGSISSPTSQAEGFAPYLLFPGYFSRALGRQVQLDMVFYRE